MAESPGSPLSSIASDELTDDMKLDKDGHSPPTLNMPPSKRRRTGITTWDPHTPMSSIHDDIPPTSPSTSISSDTSGDIPNSPSTIALLGLSQDDDYGGQGNEQVSICRWEGCGAGDLGNMDDLVKHIHHEHIGTRQKRYSCEWSDCSRKGQTHASGYALRAHMRSHTREKPFYCALPECDRSFTRSDALTKHMRTVHETEALRPSDPMLKNNNPTSSGPAPTPSNKLPRIKLKLSHPPKDGYADNMNDDGLDPDDPDSAPHLEYAAELGFDVHETSLRPQELFRLLRRQIHWAGTEAMRLRGDWEAIEPQRKEAWRSKEAIFDDLIDAELKLFALFINREGIGVGTVNGLDQSPQRNVMSSAEVRKISEPGALPHR